MNTNRDLNYRLYVQKMEGFTRTPFHSEFEKYRTIQSGDVEQVRKNFANIRKNFLAGKGTLSNDPVRNMMYHLVVSVALTSRICVEGGMGHDEAYTLSDIYIQRGDRCTTCEQILDVFEEMQVDFAKRMREAKKNNVNSIHIRKCIDYIYEHLHEKLTIQELADYLKLNTSYLSKLFAKETGSNIKEFITHAKINTAQNMLKNSDFSYLDIALALGFSTQSAFISTFKKLTGMTPKEYRTSNYHNTII